MPELPEVETTRRGITPFIVGPLIDRVDVRQPQLRWPIPKTLPLSLPGQRVHAVERRGKYILMHTAVGSVILHLGMSGSLRIVGADQQPRKHDHCDIVFENNQCLRFHDPRRFGCILWTTASPFAHPLIKHLGVEPLSMEFNGDYLYHQASGRSIAIKNLLMDSQVVVGIGNIYANEALFVAGINPKRAAGRISQVRLEKLAQAAIQILSDAIDQGGTTLRDFVNEAGRPGYFQQTLNVYGRGGEPCPKCSTPLRCDRIGQRSTFYCLRCQT